MTYYDELGIPRNAGVEEIRAAYKQVALLVHPDRFQDTRLRSLAELQMKRLNQLYETLSNLERRRAYDQSIQPKAPIRGCRQLLRVAAAAMAGACVAYLVTPSGNPAPPRIPRAHSPTTASGAPAPQAAGADHERHALISALRSRLRQAEQERDEALERLRAVAVRPQSAPTDRVPGGAEVPPLMTPSVPNPAPPQPRERAQNRDAGGLSGNWYYVRPAGGEPPQNLYPPEYIECTIAETAGGSIEGRYRARYRISDRAISPEVVFRFAGGAQEGVLHWQGPGEARGEARIRPLGADRIELSWRALELGRFQGLAYGTAILVRRREDP